MLWREVVGICEKADASNEKARVVNHFYSFNLSFNIRKYTSVIHAFWAVPIHRKCWRAWLIDWCVFLRIFKCHKGNDVYSCIPPTE
jgi:hypothetical protein